MMWWGLFVVVHHRVCSMVVETIKRHKDFSDRDPQYQTAVKVRPAGPGAWLTCGISSRAGTRQRWEASYYAEMHQDPSGIDCSKSDANHL